VPAAAASFFSLSLSLNPLTMPPPSPATLRLINLAETLRDDAVARLGLSTNGPGALTDPPGEPHQW
jgi:hypothetical protein